MKTLLSIAATLAALTASPAALAGVTPTAAKGHYEWQSRPVSGPNKSNLPGQVRVWVKDAADVAGCNCAMMQETATAADCMAMPHKGAAPIRG